MHTMEYYLALKEEGNSDISSTWMHLKDKLIEVSQKQNDKHCMIPLNRGTYNSQIHREKNSAG